MVDSTGEKLLRTLSMVQLFKSSIHCLVLNLRKKKKKNVRKNYRDVGTLPKSFVFFYLGYVETKVIPAGARNIRVEEVRGAPNYLALRSSSGKWYLNGDWYIQQSGEYTAGGTTVFYRRRHNRETFEAVGPTNDELHIMVGRK